MPEYREEILDVKFRLKKVSLYFFTFSVSLIQSFVKDRKKNVN